LRGDPGPAAQVAGDVDEVRTAAIYYFLEPAHDHRPGGVEMTRLTYRSYPFLLAAASVLAAVGASFRAG
jgi:hypothetical protein